MSQRSRAKRKLLRYGCLVGRGDKRRFRTLTDYRIERLEGMIRSARRCFLGRRRMQVTRKLKQAITARRKAGRK